MRTVVTGASGYIGSALALALEARGDQVHRIDVSVVGDIMSDEGLAEIAMLSPDLIFHLAAHKYADRGEDDPAETAVLNVGGTGRIVSLGFPVILASTCKAGDAVTCYGASKLIAERIVLNAGGRVLRLVNVIGSTGSVAAIWAQLEDGEPLPVTSCSRMWITVEQAVAAFLDVIRLPSGKYIPVGERATVAELAHRLYPGRDRVQMKLRRGDRRREPVCSSEEYVLPAFRRFGGVDLFEIRNVWNRER